MEESLSNLLWLLFKFKLLRKEAGDKRWKPNIYDFPQTLTIASTLSFRKVQGIAVTAAKKTFAALVTGMPPGEEEEASEQRIENSSRKPRKLRSGGNFQRIFVGKVERSTRQIWDLISDPRTSIRQHLPWECFPFPCHLCFYLWTFQLSTFVSLSTFELSNLSPLFPFTFELSNFPPLFPFLPLNFPPLNPDPPGF